MKKSEMVNKISKYLGRYLDVDEHYYFNLSGRILDLVEKEGMQPPNYTNPPYNNVIGFAWEPEDEKN
jgi:hypothetical protein